MTYKQLTQEQRYQIRILKKMNHSQTDIADAIGVHRSTICRELKRNIGKRGYRPQQAHRFALARRIKAKSRIDEKVWQIVEDKLKQEWSPQQIAERLKKDGIAHVSHERIYQYILKDKKEGGELYKHLRCQKKRKKRYGTYDRRGQIPDKTSIDERPEFIEDRKRLGDMEIDTIIGKGHQGGLVTVVDRASRYTFVHQIGSKQAKKVKDITIQLLEPVASCLHTITSDNGKEFAQHQTIADELDIDYYFAHPYASWERGTNENTNGLIRQYFPKDTNFLEVTDEEVEHVAHRLNHRPRKSLGYLTPHEVFCEGLSVAVTS